MSASSRTRSVLRSGPGGSPTVTIVIPLALGAALLHAIWNVLLKSSGDPLALSARAVSLGVLAVTPIVVAAWLLTGRPGLSPAAWGIAGLSAVIELVYFLSLSEAYRRGEISVVYPLARGTAPVLAVLIGLLVLRERLTLQETVGVGALLAGIWLVRKPSGTGKALAPALLTGVAIAIYTAVDRIGVRLTVPWLYGWVLGLFTALLLVGWTRLVRSSQIHGGQTPGRLKSLTLGLLMIAAYLLVLVALRIAPLAIVAPLRESAIVLVAGWGIWRLGEREGAWLRCTGAIAIVLGIGALSLR